MVSGKSIVHEVLGAMEGSRSQTQPAFAKSARVGAHHFFTSRLRLSEQQNINIK
jgi:hypothetical protein